MRMKKIRIYELAKELGLESKVVVDFLHDLGAEVSNHMSTIEPDIADMLREHYAPEETPTDLVPEDDDTKVKKVKKRSREEREKDAPPKTFGKKKGGDRRSSQSKPSGVESKEPKVVVLGEHVSVNELAQKLGVAGTEVIKQLMKIGIMASLSQTIDYDIAAIVAGEFGIAVKPEQDLADEIFAEVC